MADAVKIPVVVEITDIQTGALNVKDMQKAISSYTDGIKADIEKVFKSIDPEAINKPIKKASGSVYSTLSKISVLQAQVNEQMAKIGSATTQYEEASLKARGFSKEIANARGELLKVQSAYEGLVNFFGGEDALAYAASGPGGGALTQQVTELQTREQELKKLIAELSKSTVDPKDFIQYASQEQIAPLVVKIQKLLDMYRQLEDAEENLGTTVKENEYTSEYQSMIEQAERLRQTLTRLNDRSKEMDATGTGTETTWSRIDYQVQKASSDLNAMIKSMRDLVKTGQAFRFGEGTKEQRAAARNQLSSLSMTSRNVSGAVSKRAESNLPQFSKEYRQLLGELASVEKKIDAVKVKSQEMAATGATEKQWANLVADANELEGKLDSIIQKLKDMVEAGKAFRLPDIGDEKAEETDRLSQEQTRLGGVLKDVTSTANEQKTAMSSNNDVMSTLSSTYGTVTSVIKSLQKVVNVVTGIWKKHLEVVSKVAGVYISIGKAAKNVASKMIEAGKNIFSSSSKKKVDDYGAAIRRLWKNVLQFGLGFRSTYYLIKKLRTLIVNEFKLMAQQIPEVNQDISEFVTALNQLKGSLATAFQPIISSVIPAITSLINVLATAMNTLAKFFATLSGQGYIYKFTAAQQDYAASLSGTASAAKEAQKALMGFDEINRLDDDSDSGGGGAGSDAGGTWQKEMLEGGSNFAEMLKAAWASNDWDEVAKVAVEWVTKALNKAADWIEGPLYTFGDKIISALVAVIEQITATFEDEDGNINMPFFDAIANIGSSAFQTLFKWADKLVNEVDWSGLGKGLGYLVNQLNDMIPLSEVGRLAAEGLLQLTSGLTSFLTEIDFSDLANNIISGFTVFVETLEQHPEIFENFKNAIWTAFEDLIYNTDWDQLWYEFTTLVDMIINGDWSWLTNIVTTLITKIASLDYAGIGASIATFINNIWNSIDFETLGDNLSNIIVGIINFAFSFITTLDVEQFSKDVSEIISKILDKMNEEVDGSTGWEKLGLMASTLVNNLLTVLTDNIENGNWLDAVNGIIDAINTYADNINKDDLMTVGTAILGSIAMILEDLAANIDWLSVLLTVVGWILAPIGAVIEGIVEGIFGGLTIDFLTIDEWVCDNIVQPFIDAIKEFFGIASPSTVMEELGGFISEGLLNGISEKWTAIQEFFDEKLPEIKEKISTKWDEIKTNTSEKWENIKTTIKNKLTGMEDDTDTSSENIKTTWTDAWESMKTKVSEIWTGIKNAVKAPINAIIGFINAMISGIVSGINAVIDVLNKINITIPDWIPTYGGKSIGFNISTVTAPQIPLLAQGAVIPPNKQFLAMLGDQKSGTNIEAPLSTIQEAVAQVMDEQLDALAAMAEAIVAAINNKDMTVAIGDKEIGQAATRYNRRQQLVRGV